MTDRLTEVTFAVLDVVARTVRGRRPVLTARVGIAAIGDEPVHAIALRCQVRIEPLRRGYSDDEAAGLLDLFGAAGALGDHPAHVPVACTRTAMVQGFTGATQVDAAAGVHLRLRGGRVQVPARPARRHRAAAVPVQRNGFHPGRRAASRCSRCRGTARTATTCRCRCGAT